LTITVYYHSMKQRNYQPTTGELIMAGKILINVHIPLNPDLQKTRKRIGNRAFHEWIDDLLSGIKGREHISSSVNDNEAVITLKVPDQEIYSV